MRMKSFLVSILLFCSLPATALAKQPLKNGSFVQLLKNGGFESATTNGRPADWSYSDGAYSVEAGDWIIPGQVINPHSGNRMVVLAPAGIATQQIWQEVDFTGYSLATLSFWWRYEAIDYDVLDDGRDALVLEIWDPSENTPEWNTIWDSPINVDPSHGPVVSPWMFVTLSGDVSDISRLTFRFSIRNEGPEGEPVSPESNPTSGQQTTVFIDDASVTANSYSMTTIDYPGAKATMARGINNRGDIVGAYRIDQGRHAMLIRRGTFIAPPSTHILGRNSSDAFKSNDRGDVVGQFVGDDKRTHGFLLRARDGELTTLDFPGASNTHAWGINESGTVVGYWEEADSNGKLLALHGFIWEKGEFSEVNFPGAADTIITGINARGDFVGGWDTDITSPTFHGFVFSQGQFLSFDVPFPGATSTQPNDINALGHIVGLYTDAGGGAHGFLAAGETFTNIDYPGAVQTTAWGINSAGQIVGNRTDSEDGRNHGFLAQPGNKGKP